MQITRREYKKYCHPRQTIKEAMRIHRIERLDIKVDRKILNKFLVGKGKITKDMAKEFERVFGGSSQFFINLQKNYEEKIRKNRIYKTKKEVESELSLPI